MSAVLLSCLCCAYQVLAGLLLPGMFLHWYVQNQVERQRSCPGQGTLAIRATRSQYLFQCVGVGSVFVSCLFLVQYLMYRLGSSTIAVTAVTVLMQGLFSGLWCRGYRLALADRLAWLSPMNWDLSGCVQCFTALLFGLVAVGFFPHGLDNSAIGWVTDCLDGVKSLQGSQGAISYIGLLFLPGFLLQGIAPVPTIAVGMKILLSLLLAAACRRLVEVVTALTSIAERNCGWFALMLQWMIWSTFFGKYGVFETGKETAFAIMFLFVFAAELISAEGSSRRWYWLAALPLAAAVGFGAMAVPYGFILTAIFLLFSIGRIRLFRFGFCCLAVSCLSLVVSFHAMADWSWGKSIALIAVPLLLMSWADRVLQRTSRRIPVMPNWIPWMVLAVSLVVICVLLPVDFHRSYFPLDGKTGLIQLFSHQNKFVVPGLAGIVLVMFSPRLRGNAGLMSLLVFPFLALIPALVMARWYTELQIPLHPQNVWDWAKDIPNWVAGIYFAIFAVTALGCLCEWPCGWPSEWVPGPVRYRNSWAIGLLLLVLMGVNIKQYVKIARVKGWPTYTAIGGHHDRLLAEFTEWAHRLKLDRPDDLLARKPILLADESRLNVYLDNLRLFGVNTVSEKETGARGAPRRRTYWCVAPSDQLRVMLDELGFVPGFRASREDQVASEIVYRLDKLPYPGERPTGRGLSGRTGSARSRLQMNR